MGNNASSETASITSDSKANNTLSSQSPSQATLKSKIPSFPSMVDSNPVEKLARILASKSLKEDNVHGISVNVFLKYVCKHHRMLGTYLYNYFVPKSAKSEQVLSKTDFKNAANHIFGLVSDASQIEYYIQAFANGEESIKRNDFMNLLDSAYQVAVWANSSSDQKSPGVRQVLETVVSAAMHGKNEVSTSYAVHWLQENCPHCLVWLHRYVAHRFHTTQKALKEDTDVTDQAACMTDVPSTPVVDRREVIWPTSFVHPTLLWLLGCTLPSLYSKSQEQSSPTSIHSLLLIDPHAFLTRMIQASSPTHWTSLYNSNQDGLSQNRFQHHVFGYRGPTVTFVRGENNQVFCVACDAEWKESHKLWGEANSYLIQISPNYRILDKGAKLMYFNFSIRGYPAGIRFGTDPRNPVLEIDKNFSLVSYRKVPYQLQTVEVLGCGSTIQREQQLDIKKWEVSQAEKHRKINLNKAEWCENPDRYLLELAGARVSYAQYQESPPTEKK